MLVTVLSLLALGVWFMAIVWMANTGKSRRRQHRVQYIPKWRKP